MTEGLIIDGQRVNASDGGTFDVYDPSSGTAGLTLHTIDGTIPQLRRSLDRSLDAFFDLLPSVDRRFGLGDGVPESGSGRPFAANGASGAFQRRCTAQPATHAESAAPRTSRCPG